MCFLVFIGPLVYMKIKTFFQNSNIRKNRMIFVGNVTMFPSSNVILNR
jgi:hypothetical protein